jgi:general secretion pathway protein J
MMRRAAGFSLIELLVAMALLALLSALLVGGLHLSRNAVLVGENTSERLLTTERVLDFVRRQLQEANPLPLSATLAPPPVAFAGGSAGIVFIAPPAAYLADGGEQIDWLAIEPAPGGARLVLRFRPLDRGHDTWPPAPDPAAFQSVVLIDGLSSAEFSYFGQPHPQDDARWWQTWDTLTSLPGLIRLALASGGSKWPDLVVAPQLGRPANSGFLPTTFCQRGSPIPSCNP